MGRLGLAALALLMMAGSAAAASCSSTSAKFAAWKPEFAAEAKGRGVGSRAISALMGTSYSNGTIAVDRNQHFFHLSSMLSWRSAARPASWPGDGR